MNVKIENEKLIARIKPEGAELFSLFNKDTKLEYIWSGDPVYWGKTSPVLFPIVGTLRGDTYVYNDKKYGLSRHGFARDDTFKIEIKEESSVSFKLESNEASLKIYPFSFKLFLHYSLQEDFVIVTYEVKNADDKEMLFSIGGHPAFKVPVIEGSEYHDHYLLFTKSENAARWPISTEGLIESKPIEFLENTNKLHLSKELFYKDAIVLKHLESDMVSLKSDKHDHGLDFYFDGFPYLGIWAAKNADFVCIEPWCGIADHTDHNQHLEDKEGIIKLKPGENWVRKWKLRVY